MKGEREKERERERERGREGSHKRTTVYPIEVSLLSLLPKVFITTDLKP